MLFCCVDPNTWQLLQFTKHTRVHFSHTHTIQQFSSFLLPSNTHTLLLFLALGKSTQINPGHVTTQNIVQQNGYKWPFPCQKTTLDTRARCRWVFGQNHGPIQCQELDTPLGVTVKVIREEGLAVKTFLLSVIKLPNPITSRSQTQFLNKKKKSSKNKICPCTPVRNFGKNKKGQEKIIWER